MIETPATIVHVRPAPAWQIEGPLASRAQLFAQRLRMSLPEAERGAFQILVERCPLDHSGLGVGTQLGLAVAKGLACEVGRADLPATDLAERVGRGERSAVGIHGFDHGGLIFEAGKREGESVAPLLCRVTLPENWRVVLAIPHVHQHWHGDRERQAFAQIRERIGLRRTERLSRLAFLEMLPAAQAGDMHGFGAALHEFNRTAGEPFAAEQGGLYAGPDVAALVERFQLGGLKGVGQSSWGPTVYGFTDEPNDALRVLAQLRAERPELQASVAKIRNQGADVKTVP